MNRNISVGTILIVGFWILVMAWILFLRPSSEVEYTTSSNCSASTC